MRGLLRRRRRVPSLVTITEKRTSVARFLDRDVVRAVSLMTRCYRSVSFFLLSPSLLHAHHRPRPFLLSNKRLLSLRRVEQCLCSRSGPADRTAGPAETPTAATSKKGQPRSTLPSATSCSGAWRSTSVSACPRSRKPSMRGHNNQVSFSRSLSSHARRVVQVTNFRGVDLAFAKEVAGDRANRGVSY